MNWPEDFINKIICGDSLSVMKKMPDESIDMVLTSPPYFGLRDYGFEQIFGGDPDCEHHFGIIHRRSGDKSGPHGPQSILGSTKKAQYEIRKGEPTKTCLKCQAWKGQLGLEPTTELYIEHLTEIFNEVKRILKKEGTFWLNMGDTYGGSQQAGGDTGLSKERHRKELLTYKNKPQRKLMPKCLLMIPERLTWSLIQNGWILRNKIPWIKPNCMPSSVKDRFNNKWEYIFYFVKSQKNYFDLDSIREPHLSQSIERAKGHDYSSGPWAVPGGINGEHGRLHESGKNPGDIWIIPTVACPFPGVHFATFPEKLCEKAIIPGCPEQVCKKCGKARERKYKSKFTDHNGKTDTNYNEKTSNAGRLARLRQAAREKGAEYQNEREFIGYSECKCKTGFEGGIVLDPFCGVGTALYVAKELRRRFIGIDIKKEYCELAEKRLAQGVL